MIKESCNQIGWEAQQATPIHAKVVVSDAVLAWSLTPCKRTKITLDPFVRHWLSKNPALWLDEREPTKVVV